ncbi:hypothetical protein [Acidithiobacillus ferrooxidans]|uniref:hypothetical protein n=1 Tax=Acidithiobacillus ferrooxidans TaxID=920 RepID=UPI0011B83488|nr:hypothetical protein [Acidithiobacillus ferrooxidans]MBU2818212.1 hypothetical protein [Acidithiobacillus ferrooxidans]MCR1344170.1 hypothetical protein [Acidithiobacillus ferrooxidans]QZT53654.1 hypothetical protein K7B00_05660 [Acidithiobacillus ferrooxidans]
MPKIRKLPTRKCYNALFYMARLTGIEPVTYGLEGQCCPITGNKREQIAVSKTAGYALALFPVIA